MFSWVEGGDKQKMPDVSIFKNLLPVCHNGKDFHCTGATIKTKKMWRNAEVAKRHQGINKTPI